MIALGQSWGTSPLWRDLLYRAVIGFSDVIHVAPFAVHPAHDIWFESVRERVIGLHQQLWKRTTWLVTQMNSLPANDSWRVFWFTFDIVYESWDRLVVLWSIEDLCLTFCLTTCISFRYLFVWNSCKGRTGESLIISSVVRLMLLWSDSSSCRMGAWKYHSTNKSSPIASFKPTWLPERLVETNKTKPTPNAHRLRESLWNHTKRA